MKYLTSIQSIRQKCIECSGGNRNLVKYCKEDDCPLHPFRMGKNPKRKGIGGSPTHKKK